MEGDRTARRNLETLQELAERGATGKPKQIIFHFLRSPTEITSSGGAGQRNDDREERVASYRNGLCILPRHRLLH